MRRLQAPAASPPALARAFTLVEMLVAMVVLLVLVSAFTGLEAVQQIYAHAIDNGYRFYSYGDAMCVQRADSGP